MLGIVTAIEFDLVHQPTFYGGSLWFDGADAATVIERWLHWSDELPELAPYLPDLSDMEDELESVAVSIDAGPPVEGSAVEDGA